MSESPVSGEEGPHDPLLAERLAALREELPGRPLPYYRMLLIKDLHQDRGMSPREAREVVDDYYTRHGLGIPQPSARKALVFALVLGLVCAVPTTLFFLFLRFLLGR
jgi:hypothetical protein